MERKLPRNFFGKLGYTSRGCPLFWKFWTILFHSLLKVAENLNRTFRLNGKCFWFRGGSRIFFRRGCTRLLLYFNTINKPHSFFLLAEYQLYQKTAGHLRGAGGAHPLHPSPRSAPVVSEVVWTFHLGFEAIMAASYSKRLISTNLRSDFLKLLQQNCISVSNYREYQGEHDHRLDLDDLTDYEFTGSPVRYHKVIST